MLNIFFMYYNMCIKNLRMSNNQYITFFSMEQKNVINLIFSNDLELICYT